MILSLSDEQYTVATLGEAPHPGAAPPTNGVTYIRLMDEKTSAEHDAKVETLLESRSPTRRHAARCAAHSFRWGTVHRATSYQRSTLLPMGHGSLEHWSFMPSTHWTATPSLRSALPLLSAELSNSRLSCLYLPPFSPGVGLRGAPSEGKGETTRGEPYVTRCHPEMRHRAQ